MNFTTATGELNCEEYTIYNRVPKVPERLPDLTARKILFLHHTPLINYYLMFLITSLSFLNVSLINFINDIKNKKEICHPNT